MKKMFKNVENAVAMKILTAKSALLDRRGEGFVDTASASVRA